MNYKGGKGMDLFYYPPIVAIDFDGTIYADGYPDIEEGHFVKDAIDSIKIIQNAGWRTVLWTCREGDYLKDARQVLNDEGIYMDGYNENILTQEELDEFGFKDTRKIGADVYIDDKIIGGFTNWIAIKQKLLTLYDENNMQMDLFG